jgi:hypothetical protein
MTAGDDFIRQLMATKKCRACGKKFKSNSITVVGQKKGMWLLRVICADCYTQCLIAVVPSAGKIAGISDRKDDETASTGKPVNADDMLDMHNFLASFEGDFRQLFNQ